MPATRSLAVPISNTLSSRTLLPFLYHTPTLSKETKQNRIASRQTTASRRNIITTARKVNFPQTGGDIPFEPSLIEQHHGSLDSEQFQLAKPTTMTTSEQITFDRIFKDLNESGSGKRKLQDDIDDEPERLDDPYGDLNAIFEAAIKEAKLQEERTVEAARRSQIYYKHTPFRRALDDQDDKSRPHQSSRLRGRINPSIARPLEFNHGTLKDLYPIGPTDESEEQLRNACDEHRSLVRNMLERTTTDVEIWDVLEKEVFSLVTQLDQETTYRRDTEMATGKGKKLSMKKKEGQSKKASPAPNNLTAATESKALTATTLLSILQTNYAYYNLCALRLWRRRHPTTPYALHLLPHIKSLGSISYVLGASPGLYNEILFVNWTLFNDLHGVADMLQEMSNQGVESKRVTLEFLRFIRDTRAKDLAGKRGNVVQNWWDLRAVNEGWARVIEFYPAIREEVYQTESRRMEEEEKRSNEKREIGPTKTRENSVLIRHGHIEVDSQLRHPRDVSTAASYRRIFRDDSGNVQPILESARSWERAKRDNRLS